MFSAYVRLNVLLVVLALVGVTPSGAGATSSPNPGPAWAWGLERFLHASALLAFGQTHPSPEFGTCEFGCLSSAHDRLSMRV